MKVLLYIMYIPSLSSFLPHPTPSSHSPLFPQPHFSMQRSHFRGWCGIPYSREEFMNPKLPLGGNPAMYGGRINIFKVRSPGIC